LPSNIPCHSIRTRAPRWQVALHHLSEDLFRNAVWELLPNWPYFRKQALASSSICRRLSGEAVADCLCDLLVGFHAISGSSSSKGSSIAAGEAKSENYYACDDQRHSEVKVPIYSPDDGGSHARYTMLATQKHFNARIAKPTHKQDNAQCGKQTMQGATGIA